MNVENVFNAKTKEGWLVEPMVNFTITIYQEKGQKTTDSKDVDKVIVFDFLGLYFKDNGDSLPSLRITLKSDEAKRFAEKILQLI